MSKHTEKGKVFIGGSYKGGRNVGGQDITKGITTNKNNKKTTTKKDDSDTKKGKQTFRSKFVYGGSEGVDENVNKKDYDNPRKHKLRNQFDYLTDKYYGGDKEAFAKTSQGQVLLGYLQGVPVTRGGGRGAGGEEIADRLLFDKDLTREQIGLEGIKSMDVGSVRKNLTSPEYMTLNQYLQALAPKDYAKARPFSSGALPKTIFDLLTRPVTTVGGGIMNTLDDLGAINKTEKPVIPPLESEDFLPANLFANLPIDERVDSGGVNEVAQSIINNQMQQEEEGEGEFDITQFDPDSFIQGFGFPFVDLSLFNLDGTGITGLQI